MHTTFKDVSDPFSFQRSHLVWTRGNVSVKTVGYSLKIILKNKALIRYQRKQFLGRFIILSHLFLYLKILTVNVIYEMKLK